VSVDTARFRAELEERRARVLAVIAHRESEATPPDDPAGLVSSTGDNHLADTATDMYDRELDEGLGDDAERHLGEIDAALQRIEDGTYGICSACGREIDAERLEAVPWTTLCIDDKRKQEERQ